MNAQTKTSVKAKESKTTKAAVSPEFMVKQLNQDVRNSVLVVSLLVNVFVLIGWLVVEVTTRYDVALITYLQNR